MRDGYMPSDPAFIAWKNGALADPVGDDVEFQQWACFGLTDIRDQGPWPRKDVHYGEHGQEEAASASLVHVGVQG
ncbi:hypothetical protein [Streptomyces olivoreticuli]|uniref:hypothetical protein n=1 Tax=Streptomyces olivoreticuli TaxID=68246 RepID=UPI003F5CD4B6